MLREGWGRESREASELRTERSRKCKTAERRLTKQIRVPQAPVAGRKALAVTDKSPHLNLSVHGACCLENKHWPDRETFTERNWRMPPSQGKKQRSLKKQEGAGDPWDGFGVALDVLDALYCSTSTQSYDYEMNINICFPSANPSVLHTLTYIWEKQRS